MANHKVIGTRIPQTQCQFAFKWNQCDTFFFSTEKNGNKTWIKNQISLTLRVNIPLIAIHFANEKSKISSNSRCSSADHHRHHVGMRERVQKQNHCNQVIFIAKHDTVCRIQRLTHVDSMKQPFIQENRNVKMVLCKYFNAIKSVFVGKHQTP